MVHANKGEVLWQHLGTRKVIESRRYQAFGQIAAGTEDYDGARIGRFGLAPWRRLDHLGGRSGPRLLVEHGATPRRSLLLSDLAIFLALILGQ